jgi:hypothetical protein
MVTVPLMAIGIAPQRPASSATDGSRYARLWTWATLLAAAVWIAVAILQTPRLPLLVLAAGLGAVGGILFLRAPAATPAGRREYVAGACGVAGLVLVTVGVGHHLGAGLVTIAVLAGSAPSVVRWIARS